MTIEDKESGVSASACRAGSNGAQHCALGLRPHGPFRIQFKNRAALTLCCVRSYFKAHCEDMLHCCIYGRRHLEEGLQLVACYEETVLQLYRRGVVEYRRTCEWNRHACTVNWICSVDGLRRV